MLTCKNVVVNGRRTSMRLHKYTWDALSDICNREGTKLWRLCSKIDNTRGKDSLSQATRIYVLSYYRDHFEQSERQK